MKKLFLILLALMLACTAQAESLDLTAMTNEELTALQEQIEDELDARNRAAASIAIPADEDGPIPYTREENKRPFITFSSEAQLRSRLHKIELTPETCSQYLGDYYHAYTTTVTNNFGEITETRENRTVGYGFRDGYLGQFEDAAMKFTGKKQYRCATIKDEATSTYVVMNEEWTESNEEFVFDIYGCIGVGSVHLEDYECTAATGVIYVLEVDPIATHWVQEGTSWIDIYVGDKDVGNSDGLKALYNRLNP